MSPYWSAVAGGLSRRSKLAAARQARWAASCVLGASGLGLAVLGFFWSILPIVFMDIPMADVWIASAQGDLAAFSGWDWLGMLSSFLLGAGLYFRQCSLGVVDPGIFQGPPPGGYSIFARALMFMGAPFAECLGLFGSTKTIGEPGLASSIQRPVDEAVAVSGWIGALREGVSVQIGPLRENAAWCWRQGGWMGKPCTVGMALVGTPLAVVTLCGALESVFRSLRSKFSTAKPQPAAPLNQDPAPSAAKRWLDGLAADGAGRYAAKEASLLEQSSKAAGAEGPAPRL